MSWTGRPVVDAISSVIELLQRYPTPRTKRPLASLQGDGVLRFFSGRQASPTKVLESLPALHVSLSNLQPIEYEVAGSSAFRVLPLAVVMLVPSFSADPSLDEDARDQAAALADEDINTLYGDVEAIVFAVRDQALDGAVRLELDVTSPGVQPNEWDALSGLKCRIAQLDLWVRGPLAAPVT